MHTQLLQLIQKFLVLLVRADPKPDDFVAACKNTDGSIASTDARRNKSTGAVNTFEVEPWVTEDCCGIAGTRHAPALSPRLEERRTVSENSDSYGISKAVGIER